MADFQKWSDVVKNLPSDMPDDAYTALRRGWFNSQGWPKLVDLGENPYARADAEQKFLAETERPNKSSMPKTNVALRSAGKALVEPVVSLAGQATDNPQWQKGLRGWQQEAVTDARQQGVGPIALGAAEMGGTGIGALPYFLPVGRALKAAGMAAGAGRVITEGALGGAAYGAAAAEPGKRVETAIQDAAIGAAVPAAFFGAGKLLKGKAKPTAEVVKPKQIAKSVQQITDGTPVPATEQAAQAQRLLHGEVLPPETQELMRQNAWQRGAREPQAGFVPGPKQIKAPPERARFYQGGGDVIDIQNPPAGIELGPRKAIAAPQSGVSSEANAHQGIQAEALGSGSGSAGEGLAVYEPRGPVRQIAWGKAAQVRVPGEERAYNVRYAVRELEDVVSSHNPVTFQPNERYQLINDRNYADVRNQERLINQAKRFDPEYLLTDAPDANNGAPVITHEGDVIGGNSRTMSLSRVYQDIPQAGDAYKQALVARSKLYGINPDEVRGMSKPILVREIPLTEWDRLAVDPQFAVTDLNTPGTAALTTSERALADARRISPDTLQFIDARMEGGSLREAMEGPKGMEFINRLVDDGILAPQEKPQFIDERGVMTQLGKERVEKMMLGRIFDSSEHFDATSPGLRGKLEKIVGPVSRTSGTEWDLTPKVKEAISILEEARAHGIRNLADIDSQAALFGEGPKYSPEGMAMARLLKDHDVKDLRAAFKGYAADGSIGTSGNGFMFDPPTPQQAWETHFGRFNTGPRPQPSTPIPMRERPYGTTGSTGGAPIPNAPEGVSAATWATGPGKAASQFTSPNRTDVWHESLHRMVLEQGIDTVEDVLKEVDPGMAGKLHKALPAQHLYGSTPNEETFVRLATAVRTGDDDVIEQFVKADGSREEVLAFTSKQAKAMQAELAKRADSPQRRMAERKLQEVIRRSRQPFNELVDETRLNGGDLKKQDGKYYFQEKGDKGWRVYESKERLMDALDEKSTFPEAPEVFSINEALPGTPPPPTGGGPNKFRYNTFNAPPPPPPTEGATAGKPMPGKPQQQLRDGAAYFSWVWKPFLSWAGDLSKKHNFPELYQKAFALQEAEHAKVQFLRPWVKELGEILAPHKSRVHEMWDHLTIKERVAAGKGSEGELASSATRFAAPELDAMERTRDWLNRLGKELEIDPQMWIADYLPRMKKADYDVDKFLQSERAAPKDMKFFAEMARSGELDHRDTDLYRLLYNYARLGARKKFLGKPYEELQELINGKIRIQEKTGEWTTVEREVPLAGDVKDRLKRHAEFMYGIPDRTEKAMEHAVGKGIERLNSVLEQTNKHLPRWAQMSEVDEIPRDVINKFMLLQTAGGLGFRAFVPIRDMFQVFLAYPILGERHFSIGMKSMFSKETRKLAEEFGVLAHTDELMNVMVGEGGEIGKTGRLAKLAQFSLKAQRGSSNLTRIAAFKGSWEKVGEAIPEYRATGDKKKLFRQSGMQFLDEPMRELFAERLTKAATETEVRAVRGEIARHLTELSQWSFTKGEQAGFTKSGIGRIFGQYGTWSTNYVTYVKRLAKNADGGYERAAMMTRFAGAHAAILAGGEALGIDMGQEVFTNPAAYAGGPLLHSTLAIPPAVADWNTEKGVRARKQVARSVATTTPGWVLGSGIYTALSNDDPDLYLRILGATPLTEQREKQSTVHGLSLAIQGGGE